MKSRRLLCMAASCFVGATFLSSCNDDMSEDSHYKVPGWLKGNAYEVLQQDGNYSIFLKGIDLSGYKDIVDGKSILTVAAPNDEAFSEFLKKKGYSSIEELYKADPAYLTRLITFHLMYYAFDWNKLVNFRPNEGDGATDEEMAVAAGTYYKFRTYSADADTHEVVGNASVSSTETLESTDTLIVCHYENFIPVFSSKLFETLGIDPSYNYQYFFPNSTWTGDEYGTSHAGGFNICNASVLNSDNVITDNGYLYHINQVIEPLQSIYKELQSRSKYSTFLNLYNTYSLYVEDTEASKDRGYTVYTHQHDGLPNIAMEWPVTNYLSVSALAHDSYNIFAPSNEAIANMFNDFWTPGCGYSNVNDLNSLILKYFIFQSFAKESFICFPEEIKAGDVLTYYGTPVNIKPDEVDDRILCTNGALYGMDEMDVPAIFSSVVGPAFKDVRYLPYLYVLDGSELMTSLASSASSFITLIPDTAQFADERMRLQNTTTGYVLQQWDDETAAYAEVGKSSMLNLVNMNVSTDATELKTEGVQIIETNTSFNYWYVCDGKITTNALFNQQLNPEYTGDPFVSFHEIKKGENENWDNGRSYAYDYEGIFAPEESDGLEYSLSVGNDKNYPYYLFSQLLQKAGLINGKEFSPASALGLSLDPEAPCFIAFIPTNEAIRDHISEIPGCSSCSVSQDFTLTAKSIDTGKLAKYLSSYFVVRGEDNTITTYPYPKAATGSMQTTLYVTPGNYNIKVTDNSESLALCFVAQDGSTDIPEGSSINVVSKFHYLPFAFSDGCFHLIDGILK